jgi:WD40 repeat protein
MNAARMVAWVVLVLALSAGTVAVAEGIVFDPAPYEAYGAMMVPARGLAEALGGSAEYSLAAGTVTLTVPDRPSVAFKVGEGTILVGETTRSIAWPAELRYGRPFVPLRIAAEALGADVGWDEATQTVTFGDCECCLLKPPPAPGQSRGIGLDPGTPGPVADVALSADGKRAAALYAAGRCDVWDLQTGKLVHTLDAAENAVAATDGHVALSSDGGRVLVTDAAGGAELYDIAQAKQVWSKSYDVPDSGNNAVWVDAALAPDASAVAFAQRTSTPPGGPDEDPQIWIDWIEVYSLPDGKLLWRQNQKLMDAEALAVSAGGKLVGVGYGIGAVRLWETATGATRKIETPEVAYDGQLAIVKDGSLVVLEADGVHAWSYPDLKQVLSVTPEGAMGHPAADGTALSLRCHEFDAGGYAAMRPIGDGPTVSAPPHLAPLKAVAVGSGGDPIIGGAVDGTVRAYDLKTGRELLDANESDAVVDVGLRRGTSLEVPVAFRGGLVLQPLDDEDKTYYNDDDRELPGGLNFRTLVIRVNGDDAKGTVRLYAAPDMEPGLYVCKVYYVFTMFETVFDTGARDDCVPRVFRVNVTP